jgi:hypothetical protein
VRAARLFDRVLAPPTSPNHDVASEFRRDLEDCAHESQAKTGGVAPDEPTWPAKLLKTKKLMLAERVGFVPVGAEPEARRRAPEDQPLQTIRPKSELAERVGFEALLGVVNKELTGS